MLFTFKSISNYIVIKVLSNDMGSPMWWWGHPWWLVGILGINMWRMVSKNDKLWQRLVESEHHHGKTNEYHIGVIQGGRRMKKSDGWPSTNGKQHQHQKRRRIRFARQVCSGTMCLGWSVMNGKDSLRSCNTMARQFSIRLVIKMIVLLGYI